jgi:hypothetical protein
MLRTFVLVAVLATLLLGVDTRYQMPPVPSF